MAYEKTDNGNFSGKLALRRYFLEKYPCTSILDCCQGDKKLWRELLPQHPEATYLGVDLKSKKGRLTINSQRILHQAGWNFDVIDIDTYGSPWSHWSSLLHFGHQDVTVFLTIGLVKIMGGNLSKEASKWLGFSSFDPPIPNSLASKCNDMSLPYCLNQAEKNGYVIAEAKMAKRTKNAQYIGVRLIKKNNVDT